MIRCLRTRGNKLVAVFVHTLSPVQLVRCPFCDDFFAKGATTCLCFHSIDFGGCEGIKPRIRVEVRVGTTARVRVGTMASFTN